MDREESYAVFASKDWRSPFVQYLAEGALLQKHIKRYKLKKLAACYFLYEGILFKKGYDRNLLRKSWRNDKGGACRGMWRALREEKVASVYVADGLLLAHYEEGYGRICEEMPQLPSAG